MPEFVLINQHAAEEHGALMDEYMQNSDKIPAAVKGQVEYCTCPGGEHGGYWMVEAESEDEALALLDSLPKLKAGTRAVQGMRFSI
jgi:hypothetical protein